MAEVVADNVRFLDWPKDGSSQSGNKSNNQNNDDLGSFGDDIDVPF
ncbi:MAG: hypothetical protein KAX49_10525 [Halanaerobiales bacterium]|nr:hypothetical protein [Halanaerobiales bacterium]